MATAKIDLAAIMKKLEAIDKRMEKTATKEDMDQLFADINGKLDVINQRLDKLEANNEAEEKERKRSLVLIGLPEQNEERASARAKKDAEAVKAVLDELGVEAVPVATYRMGRRMPDRPGPRLVKVVMAASVFQRIALVEWKKKRERMRAQQQWARLLIRPSLSPEELKLDREERQRRWAQKNGGGTGPNAEHVTRRQKS